MFSFVCSFFNNTDIIATLPEIFFLSHGISTQLPTEWHSFYITARTVILVHVDTSPSEASVLMPA